jgi:hypothetical protein
MARRVLTALLVAAIAIVALVAKVWGDRQSLRQSLDFIQQEYAGPLSAIGNRNEADFN